MLRSVRFNSPTVFDEIGDLFNVGPADRGIKDRLNIIGCLKVQIVAATVGIVVDASPKEMLPEKVPEILIVSSNLYRSLHAPPYRADHKS